MDRGLFLIFALTFIIHLIGTLAYSVRISATRTRRIAISLSLFNILVLVSRTSNSFQAPLLAKKVEQNIATGAYGGAVSDFRWLLVSATLASIIGAFFIPTFQRLFALYVEAFARYRSVPRVLTRAFSPSATAQFRNAIRVPAWRNITDAYRGTHIPWKMVLLNMVAMAIWTVGVFSALYASYLHPELRVTSSQLSAIINGAATILMFMFIDPYLSMLTDELVEGKVSDPYFRRSIVWLTGSRIAGTIMAQLLLIPAALWIVTVAEWL
jgi:Amj-like protein